MCAVRVKRGSRSFTSAQYTSPEAVYAQPCSPRSTTRRTATGGRNSVPRIDAGSISHERSSDEDTATKHRATPSRAWTQNHRRPAATEAPVTVQPCVSMSLPKLSRQVTAVSSAWQLPR